MKRLLLPLLLCIAFFASAQQNPGIVDSLKTKLSKATTSTEKVEVLGSLSTILMNTNMADADHYGQLMTQEAEFSRDRHLMIKALIINGQRYSFFRINKEFLQKSIDYLNRALQLARENKLAKETAQALLLLSDVQLQVPDPDKAISFTTEAFSIISNLDNDTLRVAAYNSFGNAYLAKKERLLALQSYLNALRISEEGKNNKLMRSCYTNLRQFYAEIKEYDKAIDYAQKAMDQLAFIHEGGEAYQKVVDLYYVGNLYVAKKDFDMSVYYFQKSIKVADSLKYEPLKMPGYNGLLNQYIRANQPQKALAFFNSNQELKTFITNAGLANVIDEAYGAIYSDLGNFDSARFYFEKAAPQFEKSNTPGSRLSFYVLYAGFLKKSGNDTGAISYFNKAKVLADQMADLDWQQDIATELDSMYAKKGDFKQSYFYSSLYHQYKDSLQKLGQEKDLLQMEITDQQQRTAREEREKLEALERKHSVEYTGITIGIAVVFLMMVLMGVFRVSEGTIKVMGFFAFILLFEFIILMADNKIHHWTDGEPLKVLSIKIVLIAMLLPLHHWLEHKVVSYLSTRRLILPRGKDLWTQLMPKRKPISHD